MRTRHLAAGLAPALLLAVIPSASAQEVSASASAPPGVLYNGCVDHLANYQVTLDSPSTNWFLSLTYQAPDGTPLESNYKGSAFGDPASGVMPIQVCGDSADPGTFTLGGRLIHGTGSQASVPPSTFEMRNPFTNTAIKPRTKNPDPGQTVAIKIKSRDEMPGGYTRKDDATVLLQKKVDGDWKKVRGSKALTNESGKAKVKVRYTGGKLKLRAVTKRSADWDASHSRKVVLH